MAGGGKGGKQTTEVKIPEWLEGAARTNMARADEIAKIGYTPYYGPDVAAFTPMQQAAFQQILAGMQPKAPLKGGPGDQFLDPTTYQPLATIPFKPDKPAEQPAAGAGV